MNDVNTLDTKVIEKFWESIERTNFCWNWTGYVSKTGRPLIWRREGKKLKSYSASRVSLILDGRSLQDANRSKPDLCRNMLCVNPKHLVCGDESRFWSKIIKLSEAQGGCWDWFANQNQAGYGIFGVKGKICLATHYSWQLHTGRPVRSDIGMMVCHKCDRPSCVNPDHLFIGDAKDNAIDMVLKGRNKTFQGEAHPNATLTEQIVKEIRSLYPQKNFTEIGVLYGLDKAHVRQIVRRISWKHVI